MSGQHAGSNSNTTLHEAVEEARADVVQVLIAAGADIEEKDSFVRTPLLLACMEGYLDTVKVLVQAGAELSVADRNGDTCLIVASSEGHTETVRYLVGLGLVDVDQVGTNWRVNTALHKAVRHNKADVVQVLIDAGADIEKKDSEGRTPLLLACLVGSLDIVKMLVQAGADLGVTDFHGDTCLIAASSEGHWETVRYLVGLGQVDVDQVGGQDATTALHEAIKLYHTNVVQVLIDAGADIEKKDSQGRTPLLLACEEGYAVKMLVQAGAELRVTDTNGDTCLIAASSEGHTETVRYLVGLGQVDVDQVGRFGMTALHKAVSVKHADVVQVLIDAGADIEKKDSRGRTPLLLACLEGCLDTVKVLVQAGAELRVTDTNGDTCLIAASSEGHTETVRYLVGLGQVDADQVGAPDADTALHEAVGGNHADVVQVLIDAGADIEKKDSEGRTPLLLACEEGYLDTVKVLVRAGADLRVTDSNGDTCLIAASSEGHTETVRYLVDLGQVDADQVGGQYSTTALHKAVGGDHVDVVQVLIDAGADIEKKDASWYSPLLLDCSSDGNHVVQVLVRAGADVGARDRDGKTCLMIASAGGFTTIVNSLLCMGEVGLDLVDAEHWTALHHAVARHDVFMEHETVIQMLIDAGADVEAKSELVCSPLMMACRAGEVHIVRMLLEAGARLHIQGKGNIRFDAAARDPKSYAAEVQELIDSGARIEKWDDRGPSPLVCACMGENRDIVNLLVEAGAELRVTEHIEELSQHFEAAAGDRKEHKIQKVTCLITAAEEGGTETVRYLMVGVEQEVDQAGGVVDADVADIQADVTNTAALSELRQMDSAAKKRLRKKLEPIRVAWEHMATSLSAPELPLVAAEVVTLRQVVSMQEEVQKELMQRFTDCTDSTEKELLRNKLLSMCATWEHMAEARQHAGAEQQPVDADASRTDVTNRTGSNTLRQVVSMQEEVQKELIQRFTDCTDSAEKELLRNKLLSMRATWEHMAESRQHAGAEPQPVDADASRTDVTNRTVSNTIRHVVSMQEEVQKELIQRFTDCTDSAEKELLRNTLLSMRATWEHMAESRQHAGAEQQPVDADVSRTDVTNRTGSNTLRQVVSMQEEVQKELIQRFTDCTDSAEKELLRNTLRSMRATWEHMAESRQHAGAEPQPVDADASRTDVTNRTGSNTIRHVVSMQEEVQKELIQRFSDCTDSAEKELLRNKLLSMRATWEHMAEARRHAGAEQQPVDADATRTDVTNRTGSNTLRQVVSMQEEVQKELIQRFSDCTDSAEKELLRNTLLSMRATWEHMAESRQHAGAEQQPVDADATRTDVRNRTGSNTLRQVVSMQEEVQKELIQRFTDCTDSAEKELLRNKLLSMRATWEHMAESRQHAGAEQQPVDADVPRTDVTNRTGSNTLHGGKGTDRGKGVKGFKGEEGGKGKKGKGGKGDSGKGKGGGGGASADVPVRSQLKLQHPADRYVPVYEFGEKAPRYTEGREAKDVDEARNRVVSALDAVTHPASGINGTPVDVVTNTVELTFAENTVIGQYDVKVSPEVKSRKTHRCLVQEALSAEMGPNFSCIVAGDIVFANQNIKATEVDFSPTEERQKKISDRFKVTVKSVREVTTTKITQDLITVFSKLFRSVLDEGCMQKINRSYFDLTKAQQLPGKKLDVVPGVHLTLRPTNFGSGLALQIDVQHKIVSKQTIFEELNLSAASDKKARETLRFKVRGTICLTTYDGKDKKKRTVRIDDVDPTKDESTPLKEVCTCAAPHLHHDTIAAA